MVCSSVGVDFMDASLARVDCLVENAPTEENTSSGFGLRTVVLLTPALLWGVHASWRITTDGGLLCWPKLYGGIVGTLGLLGRKRANRGAHRPLVLGCEPSCCSRRLSCGWARNPSWRQLRTSEPFMWRESTRQLAGCGSFSSRRRLGGGFSVY